MRRARWILREDDELSVPLAQLAGGSKSVPSAWQTAGEFFPWIAVAIMVGWAWSHAIPPCAAPDTMNLYKFGELPVVYEGRVKPFDTLARNALKAISERQTWVDNKGQRHTAIEWLLDVITDPDVAADEPVFRIDDGELRDILGLTEEHLKSGDKAAETTGHETADKSTDKVAADLAERPDQKASGSERATRTDHRYSIAAVPRRIEGVW